MELRAACCVLSWALFAGGDFVLMEMDLTFPMTELQRELG